MIQSALDPSLTGVVELINGKIGKQYFAAQGKAEWEKIKFSDEQIRIFLANSSITKTKIADELQHLSANIDLIIPIKRQANLYAILVLINDRKAKNYQQEDITLLTTVANQASLAIENNLYIEETKALNFLKIVPG